MRSETAPETMGKCGKTMGTCGKSLIQKIEKQFLRLDFSASFSGIDPSKTSQGRPAKNPRINQRPNMRELHPELQYFCSTAERFKEDLTWVPGLVNVYKKRWKITIFDGKLTIFDGKIHYFYGHFRFLLNYQRLFSHTNFFTTAMDGSRMKRRWWPVSFPDRGHMAWRTTRERWGASQLAKWGIRQKTHHQRWDIR